MSLWKRLFGKDEGPDAEADEATRQAESAEESAADFRAKDAEDAEDREAVELARLRRVGQPGGTDIDEAIALLRHHDGSARQHRVLAALLEGITDEPSLDPVRVACASLLDERGDRERAKQLLAPARSVAAMMLAAELFAASNNLARAVSMVERVLARDIDTPGARERHERWSALMGRNVARERVDDSVTVVAPNEASSAYRLIREVARGGAGTIYEAEDELLGRRVAFKVYHRADQDYAQVEREAQAAVRLAGPGVLRVFDADPTRGWLATEWIDHGSLHNVLHGGRVATLFPLERWLPRLLFAIGRVHTDGLVHADLKPANVLFREATDPVLSDFGVCVPASTPSLGGTPGYMSPERLDGGPAETRDDVYAFGRILEDILAAREDASLGSAALQQSEAEARLYAKIALMCLAEADARPPDAVAVARHLDDALEPADQE